MLSCAADVLMASLPATFASEEEQLKTISLLEAQNAEAGERLAKAQAEATLWQQRVSSVLRQAAAAQLASVDKNAFAPSLLNGSSGSGSGSGSGSDATNTLSGLASGAPPLSSAALSRSAASSQANIPAVKQESRSRAPSRDTGVAPMQL